MINVGTPLATTPKWFEQRWKKTNRLLDKAVTETCKTISCLNCNTVFDLLSQLQSELADLRESNRTRKVRSRRWKTISVLLRNSLNAASKKNACQHCANAYQEIGLAWDTLEEIKDAEKYVKGEPK